MNLTNSEIKMILYALRTQAKRQVKNLDKINGIIEHLETELEGQE